jgi:hypothetical protein
MIMGVRSRCTAKKQNATSLPCGILNSFHPVTESFWLPNNIQCLYGSHSISGIENKRIQRNIPVCLVLEKLQQQRDLDERRYFALWIAGVPLIRRWSRYESDGRAKKSDPGEHVNVCLKKMKEQQKCVWGV